MNTLPAKELKRRGVKVLEEMIEDGPVHILKNNRPTCVVLSEEEFVRLTERAAASRSTDSLWSWLEKPATGNRSKKQIDDSLTEERSGWSR